MYFSHTKHVISGKTIRAILVPHAGFVYSGQTAAWGYRQLPKKSNPHFVIIGPSHHVAFEGLASSGADIWQTPIGDIRHFPVKVLNNQIFISDEVHRDEHDIEVQIPFLQYLFSDCSFTAFATGIKVNINNCTEYLSSYIRKSLFIISSDLSHYQPEEYARTKDARTIDAIIRGDIKYIIKEENAACGNMAIAITMTLAQKNNWVSRCVHCDTSASAFGDTQKVVGYAAIVWYEK